MRSCVHIHRLYAPVFYKQSQDTLQDDMASYKDDHSHEFVDTAEHIHSYYPHMVLRDRSSCMCGGHKAVVYHKVYHMIYLQQDKPHFFFLRGRRNTSW